MGYEPTVFNQLFNFIPRHVFEKSVNARGADRYVKINMNYRITGQHGKGGKKGVLSDRIIKLSGSASSKKYPSKMRLVVFKDEGTGTVYHFITNNFRLTVATIAAIYKQRWKIELFFK